MGPGGFPVRNSPTATVLRHLYRTAGDQALAGLPDADLLRRFAAQTGAAEVAFTVLLHRHGPAVLRVCNDLLRDHHDAEDAFQATFLVLATRAPSLTLRGTLGPWLYEVARRVSLHARTARHRRRAHERGGPVPEARDGDVRDPDLAGLVHDAIGRLPHRLRAPVVLCELDGLTYQQAADHLGWTHAQVRSRLAQGRQRLRVVFQRMGLAPAVAVALGPALPVPTALAGATARAAALVAAGLPTGGVSESVLVLLNGGLKTMVLTKVKSVGLSVLTAGVLIAGAMGLSAQDGPATPAEAAAVTLTREAILFLDDTSDPAEAIARLAREAKQHDAAGNLGDAEKALAQVQEAAKQWQGRLAQERAKRVAARATPTPADILVELVARPAPSLEDRVKALEAKLDLLLKRLDRSTPEPRSKSDPFGK
jgi:RNA polymerase sigma factor (sigma-70 family)